MTPEELRMVQLLITIPTNVVPEMCRLKVVEWLVNEFEKCKHPNVAEFKSAAAEGRVCLTCGALFPPLEDTCSCPEGPELGARDRWAKPRCGRCHLFPKEV